MVVYDLTTNAVAFVTDTYFERFRADFKCRLCGRLAPNCRRDGVDICVERFPGVAARHATHVGIGIMRSELMEALGDELRLHFALGRVIDRNGNIASDHVTFIPHKPIVIRCAHPQARTCEACGRFVYQNFGGPGEEYVTQKSIEGQAIWGTTGSGLLVSSNVWERIRFRKWKGLIVKQLPVLEEPLDGLEVFPENYY